MNTSLLPILYIGEYWLGSSARSFCEALSRKGLHIEELNESMFYPKWTNYCLRGLLRLTDPLIAADFQKIIINKLEQMQNAILVVYKGTHVEAETIREIKKRNIFTVNIYPDASPLQHGNCLRKALGEYDLVASTKIWHPDAWRGLFGYSNVCHFIPHGYDPRLHYRKISNDHKQTIDILLVATFRREYGEIIRGLIQEKDLHQFRLHIYGAGWEHLKSEIPSGWHIGSPVHGNAYGHVVADSKVCIAPVTREIVIKGRQYPGDEDTTRTYELPAMGAFFIHRRTDYVKSLFDESTEVPMFDDARELAEHIRRALKDPVRRNEMRTAAHKRTLARDSLDQRASEFTGLLGDKKAGNGRAQ